MIFCDLKDKDWLGKAFMGSVSAVKMLTSCPIFRRSDYHRRKNLDLICNAIKRISDLNVVINSRDDIIIDDQLKPWLIEVKRPLF